MLRGVVLPQRQACYHTRQRRMLLEMNTTVELKLDLPEPLAAELVRLGLLEPDALQTLLRAAVRERRITQLIEARKRIAASGLAPLTMEEIQTEIEADRAERRAGRAPGP